MNDKQRLDLFYMDINRALGVGKCYKDRVIIRLLVLAGLQTGRLLSLKVSDIDFDNFRIKAYNGGDPVFIPLDGLTFFCINMYLKYERPVSDYDNLILNSKGNPYKINKLIQLFDKYEKKVDYRLDFRVLRLMCLGTWYNNGLPLKLLLKRAGLKDHPVTRSRLKRDINEII